MNKTLSVLILATLVVAAYSGACSTDGTCSSKCTAAGDASASGSASCCASSDATCLTCKYETSPAKNLNTAGTGCSATACDSSCSSANGGTCDTTTGTCSGCTVGVFKVAQVQNIANDGCTKYVTATPTTDSPASSYNVTPIAVFAGTEYTSPSAFAYASNSIVYNGGFNDQSYYVWSVITSGTNVALNRRTISGANMTLTKSTNSTGDTAIATSITSASYLGTCSGSGYLGLVSKTVATWGSSDSTKWVAVDLYFSYVAVNGTAPSTAKGLTGNTNKNVYLDYQGCWYDNGIFFITWVQSTRVQYVQATNGAGGAAETWTLNGLYIQGINVTDGSLFYSNSTSGVQAIAMTASNTGTCTTTPCGATTTDYQDTTQPGGYSSGNSYFMFGKQNYTNYADTTFSYLWRDTTGTSGVIKYGTITRATGAGSAGTTLATDVAASGTPPGTTGTAYVTTTFSMAGFLGSAQTYGVFIQKGVSTCTGANTCTYAYTIYGYYNGSSTASANITIASGYGGYNGNPGIMVQGFGTSDGFVLLELQESNAAGATSAPLYPSAGLLQAETYFFNGSAKSSAVSLGTYMDTPTAFQDTNGSIIVAWTTRDYSNNPGSPYSNNYAGYMGKYLYQELASAASLTSIIGLLSLLIVALFAF